MGPAIPVMAGAALLKALFGFGAKKKQASAQRKADQAKYDAEKQNWDARELQRGAGLDALRGVSQNVQGTLQSGAPNYVIDQASFDKLRAPRPYSGSMPADPGAGLGYSLLSGLAGDAGQVGADVLTGKATDPNRINGPASVQDNEQERQRLTRMCAIFPEYPGCPKLGTAPNAPTGGGFGENPYDNGTF